MTNRNRRGKNAANERAQILLALYLQSGPERSLRALHRQLSTLGISLSLATLKRYSTWYRWQDQIAEVNAAARREQREAAIEHVLAMNDRHTKLARALQGAGGTALQKLLASDARLANLKPADMARLIDLGLKSERHALGESADRQEIALDIWNSVVTEVVEIFTGLSEEPDPQMRARLFAHALDRLVDERLAALAKEPRRGNAR
jgi:hypothetical protein